jgi:hypothetical protein
MIAKRTMAIWCQQWKWGIPSVYWRSSDFHITFGHIVINKNPAWSPVQYKNNIKTSVWFSFTGIFFYVFQRSLLPEWNAVLYSHAWKFLEQANGSLCFQFNLTEGILRCLPYPQYFTPFSLFPSILLFLYLRKKKRKRRKILGVR